MNAANNPPGSSITFIAGPLASKTFTIHKPVTTLGRDVNNDIVIFDPKVSRHHARILWNNGSWHIENISQKSMILVNHNVVQQAILTHNTTISLGDTSTFVFSTQLSSSQPSLPMPAVYPPRQSSASIPAIYPPVSPASPTPPPDLMYLKKPDDMTARAGTASLEVSNNIHREKQFHQLSKQQPVMNMGRSPSNEIVINEPVVSAFHAQLVYEGQQWVLIHPHPTREKTLNGLIYQGRFIHGDQHFRKPLVHGDIIRIGDEHGTLVTLTFDDGSGLSQEIAPDIQPIPLGAPVLTLGRAPANTVVLNHPLVSAMHARLEMVQGGYRIVDLNSTNHVYVNGARVAYQVLQLGDEIRIGPFKLIYTGTQLTRYDESSSIRIDAIDLKKVGNNNVVLLNDISLVVPPRKFVALVGGSGAGKSTLMDALNGLRPAQEGVVLYNGEDYYHNLAAFTTQLGYVPQDDIVHRELTVERALYYAARMRLPSDFTAEQINQRIDEVLLDVEMTERRTLMVSKLSGGQRKRVSIALELLANPSIFFLDEPTSGLDPGLDRKMMFLLRRLADRGRTIILVTHATNNINACDYICFLTQGGRLAYFGPPNEAKAYFNKTDFAEIYSTLEPTREHPNIAQEAEARFKASPDYAQYVLSPLNEGHNDRLKRQHRPQQPIKHARRGNPWKQFLLLSARYIELLRNDIPNLLLLLLQAPIVALLLVVIVRAEIGTGIFDSTNVVQCRPQVFTSTSPVPIGLTNMKATDTVDCARIQNFLQNDTNGKKYASQHGGLDQALQDFILPGSGADAQKVLFIMAFGAVLFGCVSGAREIVKEANIYRRERAVDLGIMPYMFSKIAVLGLLSLFESAILLLVVNIAEPLHQGIFLPVQLEAYITLTLCSLVGLLIGLTISAFAPNNDWAISFIPIVLIPQVMFAGAIIPFKDWFTQIAGTIFPTRWAMSALGSSIGLHGDKIGNDRLFGNDTIYHGTLYSTFTQADATHHLLLTWLALALIIVALTVVIGFALKRKDVRT